MIKYSVHGECIDNRTTKMCGRELVRDYALGGVRITPGAEYFLSKNHLSSLDLLQRYVLGDWGDLDKSEWSQTDKAVRNGERIHAEYLLPDGGTVLIVEDAAANDQARSCIMFLLKKDYWMLDCPETLH